MTKAEFQKALKLAIQTNGYWSERVFRINNQMQMLVSHHIWKRWHDEVLAGKV